jgi:hypothetical protein
MAPRPSKARQHDRSGPWASLDHCFAHFTRGTARSFDLLNRYNGVFGDHVD